ncbi:MAG: signal peptidase II [Candidatus Nanoarchaeia archaeon]|jgi:signal peptidase II|nr:signal peptidase II [Candidatus Nanoarchaeia archaeon]|tara:strand:- start:59551 stop:59961 length:411 start_codon:yes stop_codon:yes gene_type:complete
MKSYILVFFIVILDQLTKFYSKNINLDLKLFLLRYVENTGAAFGILQGYRYFLILISLVVMIILIYYLITIKNKSAIRAFSFILGGTIGNLIDRIFLGYVRDFIDFQFWPTFNVADSFITIGALILVYLLMTKKYN